MGITINVTSRNDCVPSLELYIKKIKQIVRAIANTLTFQKFPPRHILSE